MPLRLRLMLTVFGVMLLLTCLLSLTLREITLRQVQREINESLTEVAFQMQDKLDRGMFERYRDVQIAASLSEIFQPDAPRETQRRWLENLQKSFPSYSWIGLTDVSGKVLASTKGILEGVDVSARPWFKGALNGPFAGDVHEALLLQKILAPTATEPLRFVDVATPVHDTAGKVVAVIGGHLSWTWANEVEQSVLKSADSAASLEILVLDQAGTVLLGPKPLIGKKVDMEISGDPLSIRQWPDATEQGAFVHAASKSTGYLDYPGLGWWVVARQPTLIAYQPVQTITRLVLLVGFVASLLSLGVAYASARWLAQPLEILTKASRQMILDPAGADIPVVTGYVEVKTLSEALWLAVEALKMRQAELETLNQTLEARVQERTHSLAETADRLRESEGQLRAVFDNVADALLIVSQDGRVLEANLAAVSLWSNLYPHPEDASIEALISGAQSVSSILEQITAPASADRETAQLKIASGQYKGHELQVSARPVIWNSQTVFVLLARDVSREREVERIKDEFIATVSHELRTPLTALNGALALMAALPLQLPTQGKSLLENAQRNGNRLLTLVKDILNFQKLSAGQMEFDLTPTDLLQSAREAMEATRIMAEARNIRLVSNLPPDAPIIQVDPTRLQQVIANLLSNAIKYSPEGGEVRIIIDRAGGQASLSVEDEGPGIPEEFRERVFQRFSQAGDMTGKTIGTGLGLAISKAIVENMGGGIGFESQPGHTRFYCQFPMKAQEEQKRREA